jgi:hypothetical protein
MPSDRPFRNFQLCHIRDKHHDLTSAARARARCAASLPQPRSHPPMPSHALPAARHACRTRPGTPSLTASTSLSTRRGELTVRARGWPACYQFTLPLTDGRVLQQVLAHFGAARRQAGEALDQPVLPACHTAAAVDRAGLATAVRGLHAHDNTLRATMPARPGATRTVGEARKATSRGRAQQQSVWGAAARSPAERPSCGCRATRRGTRRGAQARANVSRWRESKHRLVRVRQLPGTNRSPTRLRQHGVGVFPRDLSRQRRVQGTRASLLQTLETGRYDAVFRCSHICAVSHNVSPTWSRVRDA